MQASPVSPLMQDAQRKRCKYSKLALQHIWTSKYKGTTAKELWGYLKESLPPESSVSKASVIDFLNTMKGNGLIHFTERSCHNSYQRTYYPNANWEATPNGSLQMII